VKLKISVHLLYQLSIVAQLDGGKKLKRMAACDGNMLTMESIKDNPVFSSFLEEAVTADMDNTSARADNVSFVRSQQGGAYRDFADVAEKLDKTNTNAVLHYSFDRWMETLENENVINFRQDIEAAISQKSVDHLKINDVFKDMASKANQKWSPEVDQKIPGMVLYLNAPGIEHRVGKTRKAKLTEAWKKDIKPVMEI